MRAFVTVVLALTSLNAMACSSDASSGGAGGAGTPSAGGAAVSAGGDAPSETAGTSSAAAGTSSSGGTSSAGGAETAAGGAIAGSGGELQTPPGSTPSAMPIISHGVPAFASGNATGASPSAANDGNPATAWVSDTGKAWLAYDLSAVPANQREQVLVAWYAPSAPDFINATPDASKHLPIDYTLEANSAAGGAAPPADGWTQLATVSNNDRSTRQHLVSLNGANWVRMNVSKSSDPQALNLDLDVHSAPDGATDSWLFMGDSITFMSTTYVFSDLPSRVHAAAPGRWPAIIPAGIGGTNTTTALAAIDATMTGFPGRFVILAYGTNDHANEYHMEELVQKVLAAGKTPVIPHMPWSATSAIQTDGPLINKQIDDLYVKYPAILHGPDLWAALDGRTDLIPATDVHPNDDGRAELRKLWAAAMTQ